MKQHLPNLVTLLRLLLGLMFPLIPVSWQLPVIAVSALSDAVDGALSRWLGVNDGVGKYLDPIADKVFVAGVVVTLLLQGLLTPWEMLLLGVRDVAVTLGTVWLLVIGPKDVLPRLTPSWLGKLTTVAQFIYLALLVWRREAAPFLLAGVAILGALASADYLRLAWRARTERSPDS